MIYTFDLSKRWSIPAASIKILVATVALCLQCFVANAIESSDVFITLSGVEPSYNLTVRHDGSMWLTGELSSNTGQLGNTLSESGKTRLIAEFERIKFFEMNDVYDGPDSVPNGEITRKQVLKYGILTPKIYCDYRGTKKTVVFIRDYPKELRELESTILEVAGIRKGRRAD